MHLRPLVALLASILLCPLFVVPPAAAGPRDSVTVSLPPTDQGDAFVPGTRLVEDLPREYIEEEFFVSGESTVFNYANDPPLGPTDIVPIDEDVPYTTRIIVRRPAHARRFDGTVVIEWWNSTAGFDTAPVWDPSAEYFARKGIVYVGVTNSTTALDFLTGSCELLGFLPPTCGTRYSALSLPENGLAYEMMSQIANLLRSNDPQNPLPPEYEVRRILHAGQSQQAGSIVTYASAFHLNDVNDGYFIQSGIRARTINSGPSCGAAGSDPFPDCTPRLASPDDLVRTDLPVPVYQVVTQTDFETLDFNVDGRQSDTRTFRYYEVAGGGHNTVHRDIEIFPGGGILGPNPIRLEDLCAEEINSTADGPVFVSYVLNALWQRMHEQLRWGAAPPKGVLMEDTDGVLDRDDLGNVLGGVRLPSMEAPTATYVSTNTADPSLSPLLTFIANLACRLSGSVLPFDDATLDGLYRNHGAYLRQVGRAVRALKDQGLLLGRDARTIRRAAAQSPIGR